MKNFKWMALSALAAGATLLSSGGGGCLGGFWKGYFGGWTDNPIWNVALDAFLEKRFL